MKRKLKYKAPPPNPKGPNNPKTATASPTTPVTAAPPLSKEVSQQQIKSMLADAAQILQQATPSVDPGITPAVPISPSPNASASGGAKPAPVTQGTPVTLESLNAQIETLRAMAQDHEVRMLAVSSDRPVYPIEEEKQVKALVRQRGYARCCALP